MCLSKNIYLYDNIYIYIRILIYTIIRTHHHIFGLREPLSNPHCILSCDAHSIFQVDWRIKCIQTHTNLSYK